MQQQISVITLGVSDLERSKRFYGDGFGWTPVFENAEIVFYQMNGVRIRDMAEGIARRGCQGKRSAPGGSHVARPQCA
ncbi:VOC family protein [Salipiger sp. PrR002]|uniref:VOC family protein n=1 Tax=Salipiger sp. PrR002 TaxID=2706489 RepID=UPI0019450282|nr:VOC family protein [Salipiger sp. PrR002]